MSFIYRILLIVALLTITACMNKTNESAFEPVRNDDLELTKLSSYGIYDQNPANKAKDMLSKHDGVSRLRAVNDRNDLVIGVGVRQHKRFSLKEIENEMRKELNEYFSDLEVTISTDKKILLELKKLEEAIENDELTNEQLEEKLTKIKRLSKEET
ncbi:MAG TPA: YhcN/YlaJ family sporulation lipoprotein [Pseudogracilibacillus sp.]|nr:YhcN/YlaJ family sporulation lipoprotein [Pseudogracilibacillus sp.]